MNEAPTPQPMGLKKSENGEVTDAFADDFSDDPIINSKAWLHGNENLRLGGEFNFKQMIN